MSRFDRFRESLKDNKVLFETLAAVCLSMMSLIVSYEAWRVAAWQGRLKEQELLPFVHVQVELLYDSTSKTYTDEWVRITNEGAPLREATASAATFVGITYGQDGRKPETALVVLNGYYDVQLVGSGPTGTLVTMLGRGNNVAFANLERAFMRFSSAQSWSGRLNLQRYFEARYVDRMGKTHTDYFEADSFGEKQLPAPEGEGLFHQYRQAFENGTYIELSHASPALLIEKWRVNKRRT